MSPLPHSHDDGQRRRGEHLHARRMARSVRNRRHRLCGRHPRGGRGGASGGVGPLRRGHRGGLRSGHGEHRAVGIRQHDGAVERRGVTSLRRPARRLRVRRRRRRRRARRTWTTPAGAARGIYAELMGAGSTSADAHHITAPRPGGQRCGGVHGARVGRYRGGPRPTSSTSTPTAPRPRPTTWPRGRPSRRCSAPTGPPVTSVKGVTGHALGGAGAIEAVATTLTIDRRLIPPTAGYEQPDPEIELDVVHGAPRAWEPGAVLSNSFGFGGHNGCLVIGPISD